MKLKSIMTAICVLATANLAAAAPFAYVANSGTKTVSIIDTVDNTIKATVPLTGTNPFAYSVAVGLSGQYVYVGVQDLNQVQIIDAATKAVVQVIGLGTDIPGGLAVNAAETRLYVTSSKSNTLIVIDVTGNGATEVARLAVDDAAISNPEGVVLSPANAPGGYKAYVANSATGKVAEIALDEAANVYTRTSLITVGGQPMGLALTSTGSKLYVANLLGASAVVDTATKAVTLLYTPAPVTPVSGVLSVAVRPDDSKAYAPSSTLDKIYVIDAANAVSATQYPAAQAPYGSAVAPNNNLYLAMNLSNEVDIFNTTTNSPLTSITIPSVPTAPRPTSLYGNFIGPAFTKTITSTNGANCTISPLGAIPVNGYGRTFSITATAGTTCDVKVDGISVGSPSVYPFTNVIADHSIDASPILVGTFYTLSGDWISSDGGCLVSTPAGINCLSKSASFLQGTPVRLDPTPGYRVKPGSWDIAGVCNGSVASCSITMNADKSFGTRTVVEIPPPAPPSGPVYNATKSKYYQTLDAALNEASTGDAIKIAATYTTGGGGGATSATAANVLLSCGWDPAFSGQSNATMGPLTISNVGVVVDPASTYPLTI